MTWSLCEACILEGVLMAGSGSRSDNEMGTYVYL